VDKGADGHVPKHSTVRTLEVEVQWPVQHTLDAEDVALEQGLEAGKLWANHAANVGHVRVQLSHVFS
jgi:hypothetical protein